MIDAFENQPSWDDYIAWIYYTGVMANFWNIPLFTYSTASSTYSSSALFGIDSLVPQVTLIHKH